MSNTPGQAQSSGPMDQFQDQNAMNTDDNASTTMEQKKYEGYPKLANLMSLYPATAVFRRFGELNMLNLLRLQAELQDLEHQLQEIRNEDDFPKSQDPIRTSYVTDFRLMRDWKEAGDSLQYDLLLSIGEKLQQYNAALSQVAELGKFDSPYPREVEFLRNWLVRPAMGNGFLKDSEATVWEPVNGQDLVRLMPRRLDGDLFTSFLSGTLLDIYHRFWGHRGKQSESPYPGTKFREYSDSRLMAVSNSIGAIFSSLLPTLVILVLYFVKSMLLRIGLMILFTAIFSIALSVFTEAKKVEIFSATAAFAAVEVVFIGSTSTTNSTG